MFLRSRYTLNVGVENSCQSSDFWQECVVVKVLLAEYTNTGSTAALSGRPEKIAECAAGQPIAGSRSFLKSL